MIDLDEYQAETARTDGDGGLVMHALGLGGEAGEYQELVKKHVFHGKPLDRDRAARELGDVLWYLARAAADHGFRLSEIAALNVAKLRARYPDGFSAAASEARVDTTGQGVGG